MCVARAFDMAGMGSASLRRVACDDAGRMQLADLAQRLAADRAAGMTPFVMLLQLMRHLDPLETMACDCRMT
jgi:glutamate/tyrosine decarboxylase-like PLP-dependent enzyme